METNALVAKLHPFERRILPLLSTKKDIPSLAAASALDETSVMRALQWLSNKGILALHTETQKVVVLDKTAEKYKRSALPERLFLAALTEEFLPLSALAQKAKLDPKELTACIGILKSKTAIDLKKERELYIRCTPQGKKLLRQETPEEQFLKKSFPLAVDKITDIDKLAFTELQKRGLVKTEEQKTVTLELTALGKELTKIKLQGEVVNRLTPGMLKDGSWKEKAFRAYDVEINVPARYPGKKHMVTQAIEHIKRIWLDMGFREMAGNYVQSAFWDLDALFVPQDHPAREMQDTFYIHGKAKLPKLWETVKAVHERGGNTKSRGWRYTFSKEDAEQLLLRTHTTVLSAQTLTTLHKNDLPAKFFTVGKVFRNETLDWKHLFEFYQVEGIVVDPHANLQHLKGYLTQFYKKMGYEKIRMRPAHFPYTEPSLEVDVFHPTRKEWIELGGAGIFRPEVVIPLLGFDCPVLAWGQGMERIIADYWKITDLRNIYNNDLKHLRETSLWRQ